MLDIQHLNVTLNKIYTISTKPTQKGILIYINKIPASLKSLYIFTQEDDLYFIEDSANNILKVTMDIIDGIILESKTSPEDLSFLNDDYNSIKSPHTLKARLIQAQMIYNYCTGVKSNLFNLSKELNYKLNPFIELNSKTKHTMERAVLLKSYTGSFLYNLYLFSAKGYPPNTVKKAIADITWKGTYNNKITETLCRRLLNKIDFNSIPKDKETSRYNLSPYKKDILAIINAYISSEESKVFREIDDTFSSLSYDYTNCLIQLKNLL